MSTLVSVLLFAGLVNTAAGGELSAAPPESVGLLPQSIDGLAADMRALVDHGKRAGIVSAVARDGRLVHLQAYGMRDLENGLPMQEDTIFRLYSMSRAITAVGLLTLYEQGRFEMDDRLAKFLPEFATTPVLISRDPVDEQPQRSPLTLYHLFTYTAGLGYPFDYPAELGVSFQRVLGVDDKLANGIRNLAGYPLLYQPGGRWYYGLSSDVLGRVAEVIADQPFDAFLEQRVLKPLAMTATGFSLPARESNRLAQAYRPDENGKLTNATASLPKINSYREGGRMFSGGGGLLGTVMDYMRFGQMLLNGGQLDGQRVLEPETVALMTRNHLDDSQGPLNWYAAGRGTPQDPWWNLNGYGWGLSVGVRLDQGPHGVPGGRGEIRWDGLANTTFFVDPENKIVAVAMSQYLGPDQVDLELVLRRHLYGGLTETAPPR
jgi:CubicO group peptidase (beta-lactamase class C family)